jgi:hypothetical protein
VSKGYTPEVNVDDNQATKVIKAYCKPKDICLQLVEPHNQGVNTAECAIQIFKNHFMSVLGTTDVDFPIEL